VLENPIRDISFGTACHELGEIHRLRGEFDRAEEIYRETTRHGGEHEPGVALLRLARGDTKGAVSAIRRALEIPSDPASRACALAACTEVMLAAGDRAAARCAAEELESLAEATGSEYLCVLASGAIGDILVAEGDPRGALLRLRQAWRIAQELELPYEAARARVSMALANRSMGDEEAASMELDAARRVFERLGAAPDLERVERIARARAAESAAALTPRERQVIALVAAGKTNRELARELGISDRTADRHVSNILTKLDLPNRAAATAYACEHGLV
jgi:DNA-binding CsgD family transcriptional regulator